MKAFVHIMLRQSVTLGEPEARDSTIAGIAGGRKLGLVITASGCWKIFVGAASEAKPGPHAVPR